MSGNPKTQTSRNNNKRFREVFKIKASVMIWSKPPSFLSHPITRVAMVNRRNPFVLILVIPYMISIGGTNTVPSLFPLTRYFDSIGKWRQHGSSTWYFILKGTKDSSVSYHAMPHFIVFLPFARGSFFYCFSHFIDVLAY